MGEIVDYTARARMAWQQLRPNEDFTVYDIAMRVQRLATFLTARYAEAVNAHGFAVYGDYAVCAAIRRSSGSASPSTLADELLVTRAGITGRLNRLDAARFIDRISSEHDARELVVRLTPRGRRRVDAAFESLQATRFDVFASLASIQQQQLSELLRIALVDVET